MSRSDNLKVMYVLVLVALGSAFVAALILMVSVIDINITTAAIVCAVIFLVPGRIQGLLFRDLFTARRLLSEQRFEESIQHSEAFLRRLEVRPKLAYALWLSWSFYTTSAKAMALNNLGTVQLELGRMTNAEATFGKAVELDPLYPIPYYNLAVLHDVLGDRNTAEQLFNRSLRYGYRRNDSFEHLIERTQALYAKLESRKL